MSFYSAPLSYQPDASRYYAALADLPWAVWLDSGGMAPYDILAAAPHRTLTLEEGTEQGDPFALLRSALGEPVAPVADVPFAGGALGYWGYDLARRMMALPDIAPGAGQLPDMAVGIYDWAVVLDHRQRTARLVSHRRFAETAELLPQILLRLQSPSAASRRHFPRAWSDRLQFHTCQLRGRICVGAALSAGGRLLPDQSRATLQRKGRRRCVRRISCVAQPEPRALRGLPESAVCPDSVRLSGMFRQRAKRRSKDQADQGHAPARQRCAARPPARRRLAQPSQGSRGKPDDRGFVAQ